MAVRYIERTKPSKGGIWGTLLGLGLDLAVSAKSSVSSAAAAASAGQVVHKPCGVCTTPPPAAPAGAP